MIPVTPSELNTTIIIGAMARIGIVCDAMAHGITPMSIARLWTIPTASRMPSPVPKAKPSMVADRVIQPWKMSERFEVTFISTVDPQSSDTT